MFVKLERLLPIHSRGLPVQPGVRLPHVLIREGISDPAASREKGVVIRT